MKRESPASMRSGFFVSVGVPEEMSYFRYDNTPRSRPCQDLRPPFSYPAQRDRSHRGVLRRRLTFPHPFGAEKVTLR